MTDHQTQKQVAQEGNNCSSEEQLAKCINIIRNSKRPLVELVETTGIGTETKTSFCITKTPYEAFFGTQRHLTAKPAVRSS